MKIVFNKLQTSKETLQVSFNGGTTWNSYVVSEIINDGISLDENQEYDKIQIKGSSTVLKNLDVVKSIEIPESSNVKDEMFTHDGTGFYVDLVNVKIPEGFTSIGTYTFMSCTSLTSINIPDSVTSIVYNTFCGCTSLTSITLPEVLTDIGDYVFRDCTSLKTINFKGTDEQWNAITKGSNWCKNCPSDMVIKCDYQGE